MTRYSLVLSLSPNVNQENFRLNQNFLSCSFYTRMKYGFPSLFAGVTSKEYPTNTKTMDNEGPQFLPFDAFFLSV